MIGISHFEHIHFRGEFRDYQSRVLNNADRYLADGKINIVAAPGSGKTVLGLELIRRIGQPCLIFSPTTAIREQWGERFRDFFLDDKNEFEQLFSTDLRHIKLINSLTYQALFTAMEHAGSSEGEENCYADVDIVREIQCHGIGTICLDEAHHLKNEWQKALEKLISAIGGTVKIIALTATPPYDSESTEWRRYLAMCGEVDEELFVPELVAKNTLCPHQDYIYFNYPTPDETTALQTYRRNVADAIAEAGKLDFLPAIADAVNREQDIDQLFSSVKEYIALLVLLKHYGFGINRKLIRILVGRKVLPPFDLSYAQTAFEFLLNGSLLAEGQKEELITIFKKHTLWHRQKPELLLNEELQRSLTSSAGKLDSIAEIAKSESASLGQALRMLVLTDYIRKESLPSAVKQDSFGEISVVSIFETLRRTVESVNIGVLSGSLVILPEEITVTGFHHTRTHIAATKYDIIDVTDSVHTAVKEIGELFRTGQIQILIGTKSLLGEGWDAPCINTLIMASFVGSYVLSNQMRGRAIRTDRENPDKTANIWHLVTVEPDYPCEEDAFLQEGEPSPCFTDKLISCDFELLKRRFETFMGPSYENGTIESGIERISAVKPPYDQAGIARINQQMITYSKDRAAMRKQWEGELKSGRFSVVTETETEAKKDVRTRAFTLFNAGLLSVLSTLEILFIRQFTTLISNAPNENILFDLLFVAGSALFLYAAYRLFRAIIVHADPARYVKTLATAVYETLVACELLSPAAKVHVSSDKICSVVSLSLQNASVHDQNLFHSAMEELLSPIENPRYILIRRFLFRWYLYRFSFACPSLIGKKKEYAEILSEKLRRSAGAFIAVYTRCETGRVFILRCRRHSFITSNYKMMDRKYKVNRYE